MKKDKAGNLPPEWIKEPWGAGYQPIIFEFSEDAERRRLGTPWFLTKGGYLRITVTIIGPKGRCPQGELSLSRRKAEDVLHELSDLVKALKEELLGESAVR